MSDASGGRRARRAMPVLLSLALLVPLACSSSKGGGDRAATAPFHVQGSVEQLAVTAAPVGHRLELLDASGKTAATGKADALGSMLFRKVKPGAGYRVVDADAHTRSGEATVLTRAVAPPDTKLYDQTLPTGFDSAGKALKLGGYGYLTVRDGTKLAINVRLPGPPEKGPYPTVIEYGGYAFARPGAPESSIAPVWNVLGYAVVDINVRGSGCSGGAFDFFEWLQVLDGYDAIETVARQPWVLNHRVGMAGISYGGISQLFVAQTNPPHLAAITPDSVIESVTTTLRPGAMLNTGFAYQWAKGRDSDAQPGADGKGQSWVWERMQAGDKTCIANQALHGQAVNLVDMIEKNIYYDPAIVDPVSPSSFVDKIKVPTFLSCQWQDEQTGGACPMLASKFGTKNVWMAFTNGTHIDSLDPYQIQRQFDMMEIYVAGRKPDQKILNGFMGALYLTEMNVGGVTAPHDPIADAPDLASAKKAFEAQPRITVLFDSGHGGTSPGAPVPGFSASFSSLTDGITATPFVFQPDGSLGAQPATTAQSASFTWDPTARPETSMQDHGLSGVWAALPSYDWAPPVQGKAVSWVSPPLANDMVVVGGGAVETWLQSTDTDTDLQVTVSEVRPDGQEVFVQGGWLRASYRKLDPAKSTELYPMPSARKADVAPLPKGEWSKVVIPLYAQGHAYRAGSRLRVTILAPGGSQPQWAFRTLQPKGTVVDSIAMSPTMPSRLLLPVATKVAIPTPRSATCPGLRGQPCRPFVALTNDVGPVPAG